MSVSESQQLALLNQNDKLLDELYHHYASRWALSDTAFWILYVAWVQGDGCTQRDICASWSYTKQTINTALKNLERQGYIRLIPLPDNRKSKQIRFTESGEQLADRIVTPLLRAEADSFAQLSEQEQRELVRLSQKRTALLKKEMGRAIASIQEGKTELPGRGQGELS